MSQTPAVFVRWVLALHRIVLSHGPCNAPAQRLSMKRRTWFKSSVGLNGFVR